MKLLIWSTLKLKGQFEKYFQVQTITDLFYVN